MIFLQITLLTASASLLAQLTTLPELYKKAATSAATIAMSESRIAQKDAKLEQIKGEYLPMVSLATNYAIEDGAHQGKIALSQSLYNGGKSLASWQIVKIEKKLEEYNFLKAQVKLYLEVATAFFKYHSAGQDMINLQASIELTNKRLMELKQRRAIGRSRQGEVLMAESQLYIAKSQISLAQGQQGEAQRALQLLTNISSDELTMGGSFSEKLEEVKDVEEYLSKIDAHPEVVAQTLDYELKIKAQSKVQKGHYPKVDLIGNYYLWRSDTSGGVTSGNDDWDLSLGISLPLYSGGTTAAQVKETSAQAVESKWQLEETKKVLRFNIKNRYESLKNLRQQLLLLEQALLAAEKNYKEQERDYHHSLVTTLELLQAVNSYQEAKRSMDKMKFQTFLALEELKAAAFEIPQF
ncbi:MAG: hypothetical protein A2504_07670 [Bdellovibrionales bacterium RIFOXYD12_FULL_39_22]|nr:MAG: hypothetical protein A2385_10995 [Bdellovibrionales bacterium RIFOXYB1_FULL_39_21]OFZ41291.1 MAG: hypothetical protein A2485_00690 [Bdellovibrionales bacterium RIFOXYC12_FULL_39_17]OFZ45059.1 MAG: hypothetical protein A2404_11290 [Bdellovibrionales bacterium RIFOXYC1_FULL_39_130]OFZ74443.1 MAG: hypothetical protein A2560_11325 [Bdellovibrionales bacterium RIFOXYD1_FULL_39_84]OFZ92455.1 MAG: hypothetical protein A2504_07670 [Bdellovibrionales bacterium RIFOXYD12_FULL_39_22]HLE12484.1 To